MDDFKHQTYSMGVTITASELDKPVRLRGPIWRDVLVSVGLLRPRYEKTMRQQMEEMQRAQERAIRRAYDEAAGYGMGLDAFANITPQK